MNRLLTLHKLVALVAAISGATLMGCNDSTGSAGSRYGGQVVAVPVTTVPAQLTDLRETLTSVGTARALKSVSVYAETSGRVTAVAIDADSAVVEDDLLLQLDDRDETLAVELAAVKLADAERLVTRYTAVNARDANIPESQLDDARAAVDSARIALAQARVDLDRRRITAPFAGRVGITEIDVGDRIDTNILVTTIDDRSLLLVNFSVPEVYVDRVTRGTPVNVRLWDAADAPVSGEIVAVDSRIDINSRAFIARAAIDNSGDNLRPGMAFEIDASIEKGEYLSVPELSVQWGADGPYVWSTQGDRAMRSPVEMVRRVEGRMLIRSELAEGQRVILEGIQSVRPGMKIKDINAATGTARSPKTEQADRS